MKNRAKCKLCGSIIESFYKDDYVECECGEIAVDGGSAMRCLAKDFNNFIRIDDLGNEVIVKVKNKVVEAMINNSTVEVTLNDIYANKPSRDEILDELDAFTKNIENLPPQAQLAPVTHSDLATVLSLISSVLRA